MRIVLIALACMAVAGCAAYQPDFSEYHGSDMHMGTGGTTRSVAGMEVWDNGTPNRKYRILGEMRSAGGNYSDVDFELELIVKAARRKGADALIIESADERMSGINLYSGRLERALSVAALLIKYL